LWSEAQNVISPQQLIGSHPQHSEFGSLQISYISFEDVQQIYEGLIYAMRNANIKIFFIFILLFQ